MLTDSLWDYFIFHTCEKFTKMPEVFQEMEKFKVILWLFFQKMSWRTHFLILNFLDVPTQEMAKIAFSYEKFLEN